MKRKPYTNGIQIKKINSLAKIVSFLEHDGGVLLVLGHQAGECATMKLVNCNSVCVHGFESLTTNGLCLDRSP
jgi:hypothetical protein